MMELEAAAKGSLAGESQGFSQKLPLQLEYLLEPGIWAPFRVRGDEGSEFGGLQGTVKSRYGVTLRPLEG